MYTKILLHQYTPLAASGLAAFILCITIFIACLQWKNDWHLAHHVMMPVHLSLVNANDSSTIDSATSAHLFGTSLASLGDTPLTTLQLHLTGISKSDDKNDLASKAMIAMGNNASKIYHVGDSLPYGVKIYAITPLAVILQLDDHLEQLPLVRETLQFKPRETLESS